ncbi:MAG: RNA polymerase sigma factor [Holophagales bacterium]|nr:MAG: RNA polymerase sigma factor [Holophagales bacterium]
MDVSAALLPLSFATPRSEAERLRPCFLRAADGDPDALAVLYDALSRDLYGFALWSCGSPELAEDAVQEVFCRLAARRVRLPSRVREPRIWLLVAVRRAALDSVRRRSRDIELDERHLLAEPTEPGPAIDAHRAARAVAELPRKLREAIFLRHFGELTFGEMGRVLGVPRFTAASRYRLGLARLRRMMGVSR